MWCAEVLAHGEDKCFTLSDGSERRITHFTPNSPDDPSRTTDSQFDGGHGHIDSMRVSGTWKRVSWGYWTRGGYEIAQNLENDYHECSQPRTPQSPTPPRSSQSSDLSTLAEALDRIIEEDPEPPVDIKIPDPPAPLSPVRELERWEHQFYKGWNLVSFPVLPEEIETLSDLYHHWAFFATHNGHIAVHLDGEWLLYSGENSNPVGEIPLSAHNGLAIRLDWAIYLGVRGVGFENAETIDLHAGVNLVGFRELPFGVSRPSDFLSDIICVVIVTWRGEFYLVDRAGDSGDEPLEPGQAVILIATEPTTLHLSSETNEAMSIQGWGAEKVDDAN